jgi:hypothetical protein
VIAITNHKHNHHKFNQYAFNSILVVKRGVCIFADKARTASARGVSAVVIVNSENGLVPLHGDDEIIAQRTPSSTAVVLVTPRSGLLLEQYASSYKAIDRVPTASLVGLIQLSLADETVVEKCGQCTATGDLETDSVPGEEWVRLGGGVLQLIPKRKVDDGAGKTEPTVTNELGSEVAVEAEGQASKDEFEFIAAEFGAPLVLNTPLDIVASEPRDG